MRVTVICPQAVDTQMARAGNFAGADVDGILTPEQIAEAAAEGVKAGKFMVMPHEKVFEYFNNKAQAYDRWVGGMAKFRRQVWDALSKARSSHAH